MLSLTIFAAAASAATQTPPVTGPTDVRKRQATDSELVQRKPLERQKPPVSAAGN